MSMRKEAKDLKLDYIPKNKEETRSARKRRKKRVSKLIIQSPMNFQHALKTATYHQRTVIARNQHSSTRKLCKHQRHRQWQDLVTHWLLWGQARVKVIRVLMCLARLFVLVRYVLMNIRLVILYVF